jgi:signal transduction histidine kinase
MVADETQRGQYLATLQTEAHRLMHLIENVLAYARLERNPASLHREPLAITQVLDRIIPRLRERAERSGLELLVEADDDVRGRTVLTHAASVEQILLNLVDNACKYAASATDRRIHLTASGGRDRVLLRIRDHGPGIPCPVQLRLFRPFHRSASEAAQSAPGVGLGLAFSRRLARALGGDLLLDREVRGGAGFLLVLPAAEQ